MLTTNRQIQSLEKRVAHLQKRINENKNNSFDRTELAALSNAIVDLRQILAIPGLELIISFYLDPKRRGGNKNIKDCLATIGDVGSFKFKDMGVLEDMATVTATVCLDLIQKLREGVADAKGNK